MVVFDVDEDALVERLLGRGRADDTEDTIRNRFKVYQEQTAPFSISTRTGASWSRSMGSARSTTSPSASCGCLAPVITIKSRREFAKMARAGAAVAAIHEAVREAAAPGVALLELEEISARILEERGCTSSFLGYHGTYPATLCLSPNDVIVHGIPSDKRLEEGDILSVDAGAIYEGFHGDAAFTLAIGEVSARGATSHRCDRGGPVGRDPPGAQGRSSR